MKQILLLLLVLLRSMPAEAQTYGYNTGFTLSPHAFCDTIPIEIIDDRIYLNATINGRLQRLCIDTGSSQGTVYEGGIAAARYVRAHHSYRLCGLGDAPTGNENQM